MNVPVNKSLHIYNLYDKYFNNTMNTYQYFTNAVTCIGLGCSGYNFLHAVKRASNPEGTIFSDAASVPLFCGTQVPFPLRDEQV